MSDQNPSELSLTDMLILLDSFQGTALNTIQSIVTDWIIPLADVSDADLLRVIGKLRNLGLTGEFIRYWRQAVKAARKDLERAASLEQPANFHPYFERGSELFMHVVRGEEQYEIPIASISARIVRETIDEMGGRSFTVAGETASGQSFTFTLPVEDYHDDRRLAAMILQAAGVTAVIRAGMSRHLPPAIQLLTDKLPLKIYRYNHTGWESDTFLILGSAPPNVEIELPNKLPYRLSPKADLEFGLKAMDALMQAQASEKVAVVISMVFQAALAHLMGWRSERYGVFIAGRTGAFKTSIAQLAMSIFGSGFLDENVLIRWGIGATTNSIIALSTHASDLPFLIDNFKPNTGGGARDLVNIVHAVMEGGEKDRLKRSAELRQSRPIHTWVIFTGEDVFTRDTATVARLLIVRFDNRDLHATDALTEAQRLGDHLNAVGAVWLKWLPSTEARQVCAQAAEQFASLRNGWMAYLRNQHQRTVNPARVATNLATNQLTWFVLQHHPQLGDFARRYAQAHADGLVLVAEEMSRLTAEALEANHFLETLIELITSGRSLLLPFCNEPCDEERDRFIGWKGRDGTVYLLPELARLAVERVLGAGGLNGLSNATLYGQLASLGLIESCDSGRHTKNIRSGQGKVIRVLHLKAEALKADA